jgi:hypothetical protein
MPPVTTDDALFVPEGKDGFVPTALSAGPWSQGFLHGAAVGALLAGRLEDPEQVMVRVLVDMVKPVPSAPLRIDVGPREGGRRVVRQSATLLADDQPVARASALRMRLGDVELPERATRQPVTFSEDEVPDLSEPNRQAAKAVGRDSFDSLAIATRWEKRPPEDVGRRRMWLKLLVPVLPGGPPTPVENVVACADFARGGTSARLDMRSWSFKNADLVVSLSRPPAGDWFGLDADAFLSATGTGQSVATIHDRDGVLGETTQSLLLEALG